MSSFNHGVRYSGPVLQRVTATGKNDEMENLTKVLCLSPKVQEVPLVGAEQPVKRGVREGVSIMLHGLP